MSFRCENCAEKVESGVKPVRRVTETRAKDYQGGGRGWEIVREKLLCVPCGNRVPSAVPVRAS